MTKYIRFKLDIIILIAIYKRWKFQEKNIYYYMKCRILQSKNHKIKKCLKKIVKQHHRARVQFMKLYKI